MNFEHISAKIDKDPEQLQKIIEIKNKAHEMKQNH